MGGGGRRRNRRIARGAIDIQDKNRQLIIVLHVSFHLPSSLTCSLNSIFSELTVQLTGAVNAVRVSGSTVNTISLSIGIG